MQTISASKLKAHLSAELKKVRSGKSVTIPDHRPPIVRIVPMDEKGSLFAREATKPYACRKPEPLMKDDQQTALDDERSDLW